MKSILEIFTEQVRTKEIWKGVWEFSRFKRFENWQEYKKQSSRRITKEDAPAIVITLLLCIVTIALLTFLFKGQHLTYIFFGFIVLFRIVQGLVETIQKRRNRTE